MPSRWWVPLRGVRPAEVRLEHVHAAVSAWFDLSTSEHGTQTKPYAISPLGSAVGEDGEAGVEISTLTDAALARLNARCRTAEPVRLGRQLAEVGEPVLLREEAWSSLDEPSGARIWRLDFITPATFRRQNRCSPLPHPPSVLRGLQDSWNTYSGRPARGLTGQQSDSLWVGELTGRTEVFTLSGLTVSGFVGVVEFRCEDRELAALVDPLFRLAPYSGIGSFKAKGLGLVRLASGNGDRRRRAVG